MKKKFIHCFGCQMKGYCGLFYSKDSIKSMLCPTFGTNKLRGGAVDYNSQAKTREWVDKLHQEMQKEKSVISATPQRLAELFSTFKN